MVIPPSIRKYPILYDTTTILPRQMVPKVGCLPGESSPRIRTLSAGIPNWRTRHRRRRSARPHPGVQGVPEPVAEEIVSDDGQNDEDPGRQQPGRATEVDEIGAGGQQVAPAGTRLPHPQPQEAQRRLAQN